MKNIKMVSRNAQGIGSLLRSVAKAGGHVLSFHPGVLDKFSALELVEILGLNDIRFEFVEEIDLENPDPELQWEDIFDIGLDEINDRMHKLWGVCSWNSNSNARDVKGS